MTSHSTQRSISASKKRRCAFKETTTLLALAPLSYSLRSATSLKVVQSFARQMQISRTGCSASSSWLCITRDVSALRPSTSRRLCPSSAPSGFLSAVKYARRSFSKCLWCNYNCKIAFGSGQLGLERTLVSLRSMRWRSGHMSFATTCTFRWPSNLI